MVLVAVLVALAVALAVLVDTWNAVASDMVAVVVAFASMADEASAEHDVAGVGADEVVGDAAVAVVADMDIADRTSDENHEPCPFMKKVTQHPKCEGVWQSHT